MAQPSAKNKDGFICFCNGVTRKTVEEAIAGGCDSLGELFDSTLAGVGACGGSCQPELRKMLDTYKDTGKFPDVPKPAKRRR